MDLPPDPTTDVQPRKDSVHMSMEIHLSPGIGGLAENKDEAREIRVSQVIPAFERGEEVVFDFAEVTYATQSYIHALIGEALQRYRESALSRMEFRNCSPALRSVIELVVDYSLEGFPEVKAS
jgi:hypothetical protein